ncbi:hypothetical protein [Ochrovirga pacifica]|uniref:hypothetical protein n=1 Tax=Ochrovirga pacifica TaxID=1042376 RepID=UPI000255A819|nr:hypothetical protein [Ochrovirga pacifica]
MKKTLILLICLCTSLSAFSQEEKERKHALAIGAGSGLNVGYSYKLNDYFSLTAKYGALKYKQEDFDYEIDGEDLLVDGEFDFTHGDLMLNIAPFGSGFRFVVGAGYFMTSAIDVDMTFSESVFIGDVEFTSDDVGHILINAEWDQILPYFGLGFGRAVPKTGFGFGLELGTYYDADGPTMTLDATGLIEDTKNQQELLQESFKENKFIPYVNLRFAFSF